MTAGVFDYAHIRRRMRQIAGELWSGEVHWRDRFIACNTEPQTVQWSAVHDCTDWTAPPLETVCDRLDEEMRCVRSD